MPKWRYVAVAAALVAAAAVWLLLHVSGWGAAR